MNNSYKIVLLVTIVLCGLILGYYLTTNGEDEAPILDQSDPQVAQNDNSSSTGSFNTPRPSLRDTTPPPASTTNAPGSTRIVPPPPENGSGSSLMDSVNAYTRNSPDSNTTSPAANTNSPGTTPSTNSAGTSTTDSTRTTPVTTLNQTPAIGTTPSSTNSSTASSSGSTTTTRTNQPTVDRLPNTGRAALQTPVPTSGRTYTIKSGDTLSSIARDTLGSEAQWHAIAEANPYLDPRRLKVGQVIRLPYPQGTFDNAGKDGSNTGSSNAVGPLEYVVRENDTLSAIARVHYGDPNQWEVIHRANRDKIGNDPTNIRPGMKLFIPPSPRIAQ